MLGHGLGATLYMPATRPHLADDIARQTAAGATSLVACLEDAIGDDEVPGAERNIVEAMHAVARTGGPADEPALLFVRVRRPEQIVDLAARLGPTAAVLTGFVLPKFTARSGPAYLDALAAAEAVAGTRLLAMPVLETAEIADVATRVAELTRIAELLARHRERVLAVRIGATDLCGLYGLRRTRDVTVYDIRVVADVIADVVNVLGRADGTGYPVTGPVWEFFVRPERLFKPQLRSTPFVDHDAADLRSRLVSRDHDGLIRELELDRANGLAGKTVIHPSQVPIVHALSVVPLEEYHDACDVVDRVDRPDGVAGGVLASGYGNKMNEVRPHAAWARHLLLRAEVFGVAAAGVSFVDLLAASIDRTAAVG